PRPCRRSCPTRRSSDLVIPESVIGIPGTEGSISTLADIAFVRGDFTTAERMYRRNYEASPLEGNAFAALDLVRFLLSDDRDHDADRKSTRLNSSHVKTS